MHGSNRRGAAIAKVARWSFGTFVKVVLFSLQPSNDPSHPHLPRLSALISLANDSYPLFTFYPTSLAAAASFFLLGFGVCSRSRSSSHCTWVRRLVAVIREARTSRPKCVMSFRDRMYYLSNALSFGFFRFRQCFDNKFAYLLSCTAVCLGIGPLCLRPSVRVSITITALGTNERWQIGNGKDQGCKTLT